MANKAFQRYTVGLIVEAYETVHFWSDADV